jgi:hypothetical protein
MELHDKVKFLSHNNIISDEICEIIEICDNGKTVKLKKPNGEISRIYHDRIRSLDQKNKSNNIPKIENSNFNPWQDLSNGEVWIKQSKFNSSIVLKSFVIINHDNSTYKTINIYNDKFNNSNVKSYKLSNIEKETEKLKKKGYKKMEGSK